jgi:hypothetical protein
MKPEWKKLFKPEDMIPKKTWKDECKAVYVGQGLGYDLIWYALSHIGKQTYNPIDGRCKLPSQTEGYWASIPRSMVDLHNILHLIWSSGTGLISEDIKTITKCTCDIKDLWNHGCRCKYK